MNVTAVFVHGMWEGVWVFNYLLSRLQKEDYRTVSFDLPGHGERRYTESVSGLSLLDYSTAVEAVVDEIEGPVVLIGHSMGGFLSARVTAAFPEKVAGLVLLNSAPLGVTMQSVEVLKRIWRYLPQIISGKKFCLTRKDAIALELNKCADPDSVYARMGPESGKVAREFTLWKHRPDCSKITCPCLIIGASDDKITPLRVQSQNAELFTDPYFIWVQDAGHMALLENGSPLSARTEIAGFVLAFLREVIVQT